MSDSVNFTCNCGSLQGVVHEVSPASVCHLICYCRDCRALARQMNQLSALEPGGGSPLIQVLPSNIEITTGHEYIACLRLSPKGLHRWFAECCHTPIANTIGTPKMPLAGMWRPLFEDTTAFGPVVTHGFTKMAQPAPDAPRKDKGLARMLGGLIKRSLSAYLSGTARQSPFFGPDGSPVSEPKVISPQERQAAYLE